MADFQQAGNVLLGLSAGLQGRGPEFVANQQAMQRQQGLDQQAQEKQRQQMELERQKTVFTDSAAALNLAKQNRFDLVVQLGMNRLESSKLFPEADFSDTRELTQMATMAANGDQKAADMLTKTLENNVEIGRGIGVLPAPESESFTLSPGQQRFKDGRVVAENVNQKAAGVNVNIGEGESAFSKELGKLTAKQFLEQRKTAEDAVSSLDGISRARSLLDSGVITGTGADLKVSVGKALNTIGIKFAEDEIANTEAFVAAQASQVANIIKQFGAGTGLSDADREFAIRAAAGDVNLTERSIRRILKINEEASNKIISRFNRIAKEVDPNIVPIGLQIDPSSASSREQNNQRNIVVDF